MPSFHRLGSSSTQTERVFQQHGLKPRQPIKAGKLPIRSRRKHANSMSDGKRKLTIAIEGCCHGELDNIYGTLQHLEKVEGRKIDLLISCGDFQAVRNLDDLETMACPPKYRSLNTFYKYYYGEKKAPFPTLFIGGNHEASNYMWELYHGGWAAPDIFYLGAAGCVRFGGLRIAGLSGIYKQGDYTKGRHEQLPYNNSTMRSTYHVRDFEVHKLMQIQEPIDIFLSHDWPCNIARYGNTQDLLRRKSFLAGEVASGELGSPAGEQLLHTLRPAYWFAAHLHTKFPALVPHDGSPSSTSGHATSTQGGEGERASGGVAAARSGGEASTSGRQEKGRGFPATRFLALDKCLPGRDFLQVVEVDAQGPLEFEYDPEWLAILRSTHNLINLRYQHRPLPGMGGLHNGPRPSDIRFVDELLQQRGTATIPHNFQPTVPAHKPVGQAVKAKGRMPTQFHRNPQTVALLDMLQLPYNLDHAEAAAAYAQGGSTPHMGGHTVLPRGTGPPPPPPPASKNPEEVDIELDESFEGAPATGPPPPPPLASNNPEEINIGSSDVDDGAGEEQDPMFKPLDL